MTFKVVSKLIQALHKYDLWLFLLMFLTQLCDKNSFILLMDKFVLKISVNLSMKNLLCSFFWSINIREKSHTRCRHTPNIIMHAALLLMIMTFTPIHDHDLVSETEIIQFRKLYFHTTTTRRVELRVNGARNFNSGEWYHRSN